MGKKDTKSKSFLADNSRFADVFNYFLFDGESVLIPEELEERDTTEVLSLYGINRKEIQKQKWRDLLKQAIVKFFDGIYFILLGIENQSDVHYAMPVKNMIYDSMNYGSQVEEAGRKHCADKDYDSDAEFLSGFLKTDRLTPIITLTVYWGADEWDGPLSLHEMLQVRNPELLQYVADYKLNLLAPSRIQNFDKFQTSVGEVLEVIKASKSKDEMEKVIRNNPAFRNLENDSVSAINVFTGINVPVNKKEGGTDVCKAWEEQKQEGITQGITQGISQGITQGEDKLARLIRFLLKDGKTDAVLEVTSDENARKEYYRKYGIID